MGSSPREAIVTVKRCYANNNLAEERLKVFIPYERRGERGGVKPPIGTVLTERLLFLVVGMNSSNRRRVVLYSQCDESEWGLCETEVLAAVQKR